MEVKFCKDCRHFEKRDPISPDTHDLYGCKAALDMILGERICGSAWQQRSMPVAVAPWQCGREAQFFEPLTRDHEAKR